METPHPLSFDDAPRPQAPALPGVTPEQRARGRHLAAIHALHLRQLDGVRGAMERLEAEGASAVEGALSALDLRSNYRRFGSLCGQECRLLTFHHTSEDVALFPALRAQGGEGLRRVLDRLAEEHLVIHAGIEQMEACAARAVAAPGAETFAALRHVFGRLDALVRSHFGYEETELEEALGVYDVPM